ncbi:MAG: hypothetical protein WBP42_04505 [Candidatus Zixiibacteriota bacterium]
MMFCLFGLYSTAAARDEAKQKIAIIPFANYSNSQSAQDLITNAVRDGLEARGYQPVDKNLLRDKMRETRMRLIGEVDSVAAAQIAASSGSELLITGSIDLYLEQDNPEVSVGLRIYDCDKSALVWVDCLSATGEDYAGAFGVGRLTEIESIANSVVKKLIERIPDLARPLDDTEREMSKEDRRLAGLGKITVVRFDNSTEVLNADAVATSALMAELWQRGFELLEPGEISRVQMRLAVDIRGGITDDAMSILRSEQNVGLIATGTVTTFSPIRNAQTEAAPEIEMNVRLIDPVDGRVISSVSMDRNGSDSESLFGAGRVYSIGLVAQRSLHDGWKELVKGWIRQMDDSMTTTRTDGTSDSN